MTTSDAFQVEGEEALPSDESRFRSKAKRRSMFCPGAGAAMVGAKTLAIASYAALILWVLFCALLSFFPGPTTLWMTIAVMMFMVAIRQAELRSIKKSPLRAPGPAFLVRGFVPALCIYLAGAVAVLVLLVTSFKSQRMRGSAMAPAIQHSELTLSFRRVDWRDVKPGAIIAFKNANESGWGSPSDLMISRILAKPGDAVSIQAGQYLVNGIPGPMVGKTGEHRVVLPVPEAPDSLTVPDECYFVVPNTHGEGLDSRVLSWAHADRIVSAKFWRLRLNRLFEPIE